MPTLHRFPDRPGYYVRGVSNGQPIALGLTPEGEQYMTETLGLGDGGRFAADTLKWLYKKKWAVALDQPPPGVPVVEENGREDAARPDAGQVVQLRLASSDHVALDQCAVDIVRALAQSGAAVAGPIPLPTHVEPYLVLRDGSRKVYELRQYQRLLQLRNPGRQTVEAMNSLRLPREVDLKVEMLG
jgi:small subunit ribosomal protein S10